MGLYDDDDLAPEDYGETEKLLRRVYIALSAHRGGYIFDRTLGSEVYRYAGAEDPGQSEAAVRDARGGIPGVEAEGIKTIQGSRYAVIRIGTEKYNVPIKGGTM